MMSPSSTLAGTLPNMMLSQPTHQSPAMFNPTATASSGVQPHGQPPSMMSVNKPLQTGILPPPTSNTGFQQPGYLQHQFPPPPKAGAQPTTGQPQQHLPPRPNQFPPPLGTGTYPPVGVPSQQVTAAPTAFPRTEVQAVVLNQQPPIHSVPMSEQSQPHFGGSTQPNQPPIMSTLVGPSLQTSSTKQFPSQSTVGTVQAAPPMMSTQQPPPTFIASNTFTGGGPPMSGTTLSNMGPPRAGHVSAGPPLSTGTIQAGMPPPPSNKVTTM